MSKMSNFNKPNPAFYKSGMHLEKYTAQYLSKEEVTVSHNNFDLSKYMNENRNEGNGNIVDIKAEIESTEFLIECCNLKENTRFPKEYLDKKIEYFTTKDPEHKHFWGLVISWLNISKESIMDLVRVGIHPIVLNLTATATNRKEVINRLFNSPLHKLLEDFKEKKKRIAKLKIKNPILQKEITEFIANYKTKHQQRIEEVEHSALDKVECSIDGKCLHRHLKHSRKLQVFRLIEHFVGNWGLDPTGEEYV
jgi:hypothetical protein